MSDVITAPNKDLGAATAYGYAKQKGYSGTEEEYAVLMASYASVAQEAKEYAEDAEAARDEITGMSAEAITLLPGSSATASYSDGVLTIGVPRGDTGADGAQGYSPTISVESIPGGHRLTVTDAAGEDSFDVLDGSDGADGAPGATGPQGPTGADGLSPDASVERVQGGAQITITDTNGTTTATVYDGDLTLDDLAKAFPTDTESGSIVTIQDGADNIPVQDLTVQIMPVQAGSGDPSPSNIRPITGWTGATARRTGVNLWGGDDLITDIRAVDPTATVDTDNRTITFPRDSGATFLKGCFKPNTQYTIIYTVMRDGTEGEELANVNLAVRYTDGTTTPLPGPRGEKGTRVLVTSATKSVSGIMRSNYAGNSTMIWVDETGVFEGVLTAADFVPYAGQAFPVSWQTEAGEVFGGTLDVTTGVLTVTHVKKTIHSSDLVQVVTSGNGYGIVALGDYGSVASYTGVCNALAKHNGTASTIPADSFMVFNSGGYNRAQMNFRFDNVNLTTTAYKAKLDDLEEANTPLELVYEITTGQATYQLTAQQITTLLGVNNIWADTGDVSVTYRADPDLYSAKRLLGVKSMIAGVEAAHTATRNYAAGDLFVLGSTLCRATASIANGGTITPGSNCTETTVAAEIASAGGGGGTSDYDQLSNRPQINGNVLTGNKTAAQLGLGTYSKPSGGIPSNDLAAAVQTSLGKADTALQSAPVQSVNGKTGAVVLSASDVGAGTYSKPSGGIPASDLASGVIPSVPTKVSDLINDSGFVDSAGAASAAPVQSVNGQTGAVSLTIPSTASDVGAIAAPSSPNVGDFLVYTANGWVASALPLYNGGVS